MTRWLMINDLVYKFFSLKLSLASIEKLRFTFLDKNHDKNLNQFVVRVFRTEVRSDKRLNH